jgi:hypothetical protein
MEAPEPEAKIPGAGDLVAPETRFALVGGGWGAGIAGKPAKLALFTHRFSPSGGSIGNHSPSPSLRGAPVALTWVPRGTETPSTVGLWDPFTAEPIKVCALVPAGPETTKLTAWFPKGSTFARFIQENEPAGGLMAIQSSF